MTLRPVLTSVVSLALVAAAGAVHAEAPELKYFVEVSVPSLDLAKELVETRKYRPVIDRSYALDEVVEATRYVETGQKTGNVVLRVSKAAPGRQPEPATKHDEEARA